MCNNEQLDLFKAPNHKSSFTGWVDFVTEDTIELIKKVNEKSKSLKYDDININDRNGTQNNA